nr:radical SAM family heme chaperone HemW [Gammaproteobacteria bacterium]
MIPLSLYIHIPWCVKKCPYCDFNSHPQRSENLPEADYCQALLVDLQAQQSYIQDRPIQSIFIGGGTPSLFSAEAYHKLFTGIHRYAQLDPACEITLEANPGTFEQQRFKNYFQLGINRLSIGIQSFNNAMLKKLGRIHNADEATRAVEIAKQAGFKNINIDLMHGLPEQSTTQALQDLQQGLDLKTSHLSWYQLTLEPNTYFYQHRPALPQDELIDKMQTQGQALLHQHGFNQYEVSAFAHDKQYCLHNLNYWQYGDYLGIGAGAHGKITDLSTKKITRVWSVKHPKVYLQ